MEDTNEYIKKAQAVLDANQLGNYTTPNSQIYPHQWLWDSCFVAYGLAEYQPQRAATEINNLLDAQWANGMVPHMILNPTAPHWLGPSFWPSQRSSAAPKHVQTSGMTQPPLLSLAALNTADKLPPAEGKIFLKQTYPKLLAYHQWLYRERDPLQNGLVVLVHSWECGLDNSPPWIEALNKIPNPLWLATFFKLKADKIGIKFRHDTQAIPPHQRLSQTDAVKLLYRAILFRKNRYDSKTQIKKSRWLIEDVTFNSILIAANRALFDIATILGEDLPADLNLRMQKAEQAIEELWDGDTGQYYSRNFRSKKLIKTPSIASLMPLFSGCIDKDRAQNLVSLMGSATKYRPAFPVPSVPLDSPYFDQHHYWQGPTWANANWLLTQGLIRYGYLKEASYLQNQTLRMIEQNGWFEYFSPLSGKGYGANNFSWTAALYIHLARLNIG